MKRTGMTRYLTLSLAALMSVNLMACGSAGTDTTSTKAEKEEAQSQTEDIKNAITKVVGNGEEGGADKEETVYVFTDANGNTKNITVSNWLKNVSGNSKIKDSSTLSDIENVEGDEKHTKNGDNITWDADGNDIYYQGKTNKKPPVSQEITYYLDGKAVDPKDLAGKSGHVKIHIDYTNTEKYKDVYVPFTAVTGIALDNKNVKNVKVDHGSVVSEGKHTVVVGMAFPGLQDSLQSVKDDTENMLDEVSANQKTKDKVNDLDIPSSVEIEMDATDFQLSTGLTMVFSNLLTKDNSGIDDDEVSKDHDDALDEMDDKVSELTDDGDKLADGATELSDGIKTANDNMPTLKDGADQLADGVKQYTDGVSQLDDGVSTLKNGTSQLASNSSSLKSGANQLDSGISTLKSGADQLTSNSASLVSGANQLAEGTQKFMAYANAIGNDGGKALTDQVGKQAQSELLNSDEYKSGKQQMLGQVNGMTSQFDSSKKFVNAYFDIAYKAATGQTMSADEQKSYSGVKDNDQFRQLVSSIQKSAPQVTSAVTNALTANQDELKKLGTEEVTRTLTSEDGQKKINDAVTSAVSANNAKTQDAVTQAVTDVTKEGTEQYRTMQQAITSALSDETALSQEITQEVTKALGSEDSKKAISDAVEKSVSANQDQITKAVTSAMDTEAAQSAISKSVTEALKKEMTDPKNADPKTGSISTSVNQAIGSDIAEIQKTVAGSISQNQVTGDVQKAMAENADLQNLEKEMQTLQEQIATLQAEMAKMPAEQQKQMAALLSPLTQSLQNIEATVNSAKTSIAQSVGAAATKSIQTQMAAAGSKMTNEITKTVQDATQAAVSKTTEIAGSTAGAASASAAANIAGTAAATAAANLAATAAAPVVANIAVQTALGEGIAPKVAKAVGEATGTAIATVAAKTAGEQVAATAATAAASAAADMTSDALQQSVVPKVAEIAGGAAAMTTGKNTMNATIDSVQATMQKQIGGMDLSATIDQMSGKIAYSVGSGVVKEALAKIVGSSEAGQAQGGLTQLNEGAHQLASGIKSYTDGVSQVASGAGQLKNGSSQLAGGISTYTDGVDQVNNGVDTLKSGTSQLASNSGALVSGTETLSEGAQQLADGMAELLSGSVELKDGVVKFNDEGIKKLADLYNTDVKTLDDKVQELKDAAKSYKTFTGSASDEDSTVKFIYKMDSIETDDDKD